MPETESSFNFTYTRYTLQIFKIPVIALERHFILFLPQHFSTFFMDIL
jgi:hypothetical protein